MNTIAGDGHREKKTDKKARQKLLKARTDMVLEHPFFASLALRLDLREDRTCSTAYTDGRVFGYNPEYVKILSHEKLVGLAAHTVMHPACGHHKRRKGRDPSTWNMACDYVVNPILLEAGLSLPDGFLLDAAYTGKTADAVYTALKEGKGDDESKTDDKAPQENQEPEESKNQDDKEGLADGENDRADVSDNDPSSEPDPGMSGEVRDAGSQSDPAPGPELKPETDWEQAMVQAAAAARAMGKLPRGLDLFVEERLRPRLPWQELLARFIQQSARQDYTWTRPNRRYIHQGLYFPTLVSDQLAEIAVAVDTSGSIRPGELSAFGNELSAILEMNPSRLHLIYADMAVTGYQVLSPWDLPVDFCPNGGGGTDFRAVFDFLAQEKIRPFCLVFLSDMECRLFPAQPPDFPVLWVKVGQGGVAPPFGRQIQLCTDSSVHNDI